VPLTAAEFAVAHGWLDNEKRWAPKRTVS